MICVTGASGTVGSEVIKQLGEAKAPFRAAYFSEQKAQAARSKGIDAVTIDYGNPETLRAAFKGCDKLFLLGPNTPDQTQLELNAVEAAKAGIRHIVKLSMLGADEEAVSFAKTHRPVEKAIESSGIGWTFLRPNGFMQNVVTYLGDTIKSEGNFYTAAGDAKISHVDVRDIAAVAVKALTETGHERKVYTLTGPQALTYDEIADELSNVLGRKINHIKLSPAEMKGGLLAAGIPEGLADSLLDLERYYREQRASFITGDIKTVIGRDPIKFEQYARDHASSLKPIAEIGAAR
ncbi:MAG TPA: SDR family oxidoreductase [Blastocatellia bacterium]|nr:SDR family oxidoreductase [Blastocatellia bacterium]